MHGVLYVSPALGFFVGTGVSPSCSAALTVCFRVYGSVLFRQKVKASCFFSHPEWNGRGGTLANLTAPRIASWEVDVMERLQCDLHLLPVFGGRAGLGDPIEADLVSYGRLFGRREMAPSSMADGFRNLDCRG